MLPKKFSIFPRSMQHLCWCWKFSKFPRAMQTGFFDLRWSLILGHLTSVDLWSFGLRWSLIFWSELIFDLWSFSKVDRFLIFDLQLFLTFWSLIFSWSDLWTPQFMISSSKFKKKQGCSEATSELVNELCFDYLQPFPAKVSRFSYESHWGRAPR